MTAGHRRTLAPIPLIHHTLQKAVESLVRAQARLDHARNGAAAKAATAKAAAAQCSDVDIELQVRPAYWPGAKAGTVG